VEQWFQNTRGLVIVILAVITGAVLLAIQPGDGFPSSASSSSGSGGTTVTTTVTTLPAATTTTVAAHQTIQEGTPNTSETTLLQQQLNAHGYNVGTPDGSFGPATTDAVKKFQTANGLPATGVVDAATWNKLLASPSTASTTTTTKP
jgi:peptidoglycan hydrolase-like protein with peptidoglycan-binding domain